MSLPTNHLPRRLRNSGSHYAHSTNVSLETRALTRWRSCCGNPRPTRSSAACGVDHSGDRCISTSCSFRKSCGDAESAHRSFDKPNRKSSSVGCGHMWTDTYAFQARPFYESMGFVVFGRLDGPAPTFPRFFLMKDVGKMSK